MKHSDHPQKPLCKVGLLACFAFAAMAGDSALAAPSGPFSVPMQINCTADGGGRDIKVGSGVVDPANDYYANLRDFDWRTLKAGDTVRLFWRPQPYAEKVLISASGLPGKPIRFCGVAGPNGERPVITGQNAQTRSGLFGSGGPEANYIEDLGIVQIYDPAYGSKPAHIVIEGLEIRDTVAPSITTPVLVSGGGLGFIAGNGQPYRYQDFAACIRIQEGDHITLRGNELSNCGQGLFVNGQAPESRLTRNLLIEGNYLHGNGVVGVEGIHSAYLEATGVLVQFNYFGPNRDGARGSNYKSRSSGEVVRYNYFENGARILDLIEPQASADWTLDYLFEAAVSHCGGPCGYSSEEIAQGGVTIKTDSPAYRDSHVYGNILVNDCRLAATCSTNMIHLGADNISADGRRHLWFYNNDVAIHASYPGSYYTVDLFDLGPYDLASSSRPAPIASGDFPRVDAFNNAIYLAPSNANPVSAFSWSRYLADQIDLGRNWISTGWNQVRGDGTPHPAQTGSHVEGNSLLPDPLMNHPDSVNADRVHHVSGLDRQVCGSNRPFDAAYAVAAGSPLIDQAEALPNIQAVQPLEYQIAVAGPGRLWVTPRVLNGNALDLGAAEAAAGVAGSLPGPCGAPADTSGGGNVVADTTPDAFDFADRLDMPLGVDINSAIVQINGLTAPAAIKVSGDGSAKYWVSSFPDRTFTNVPGMVRNGDLVQIQVRSSSQVSGSVAMKVDIGGVADDWQVVTTPVDTTPDRYDVPDRINMAVNTDYNSVIIQITGLAAPAPISVSGDASAKYWLSSFPDRTFSSAPGLVHNGDLLQLQLHSASQVSSTVRMKVNIGGISDTWQVTTSATGLRIK